jgi:hypothetical protein
MSENTEKTSKLELKPAEVAAGAGAAVVTAFASSALGVAGTLIGAAFASALATVSFAVLRRSAERADESLRRTNARLRQVAVRVPASAAVRPAATGSAATPPAAGSAETPGAAGSDRDENGRQDSATRPWTVLRRRWVAITAGAVAAFVIALIAITGVESAIGKPLASLFGRDSGGGTSLGSVVEGGDRTADPSDQRQDPSPASTPTAEAPAASTGPAPASPTPVDATGSSAPSSPDLTPSSPAEQTPSPSGPLTSPPPSP